VESADLFAKKILVQYAAVRALNPQCVVETGVANGVSSSYLLLALHKNGGSGRLHSIGLDDPAFLPPGDKPGWLVPDWLREGWRFISETRVKFFRRCCRAWELSTSSFTIVCTPTST